MIKSLAAVFALVAATPAAAREIFAGLLVHGVETPLTFDTEEGGVDVQIGFRGGGIAALSAIGTPAPYAFVSFNSQSGSDFAAAGLAWTLGRGAVYVRPAIGLAIHDSPAFRIDRSGQFRTDLGSRILFAPELGIGYRVLPRWTIEAQWTHLSHAQLAGPQNPGLDMIGTRVSFALR